ncbi:MAG: phenylacetate-CoA oxygenase subunit PaaC [Anaerolineae bacterium]|nr:phenylacetate-CoA oxygenase subunit PaaC [Anaerolineae bacterium]
MDDKLKPSLAVYLIALADDELILAHRHSEWCGHAPILEEDIAFSNLCLDEIGHATIWYQLAADLLGEDRETYPDQLAFFRDAEDFLNIQMVELPIGDWAFSMLRQYLFDAYEVIHLERLVTSKHKPIAEVATKIRNEELYHLRHTRAWVHRLGLGTDESRTRMQRALDELWPYALQLFASPDNESLLVEAGLIPASTALQTAWITSVVSHLEESGLKIPPVRQSDLTSRNEHSEHLPDLLAEMQKVARLVPGGVW